MNTGVWEFSINVVLIPHGHTLAQEIVIQLLMALAGH